MKIQDNIFGTQSIFRKKAIICLILFAAFLIRIYNFSFPFFTSDEARIAYRGYTLATFGKDELGRFFPVLFNSLKDYDLPLTSYLTAGGEMFFGKSDLGARMPFVIIGTLLVLLVYQIAKFFSQESYFRLTSAFIAGFSPTLIFLSKIPNQSIVLT
ncbi:MAG: glycosyltransferase family 39 protein, partial [Actinobacteria bacterium]|nr:glycosyltransferase family 39 protein [Actinomycetota bacterium]